MRQVESKARTPKGRLSAVFDVAESWFSQQNFYGCMFINAVGEHSTPDTSHRYVCRDFKRLMPEFILDLCVKAGAQHPQQLAEELALLLEGAIVTAQVSQKPEAAKIAKRAAEVLIDRQTGKPDSRSSH